MMLQKSNHLFSLETLGIFIGRNELSSNTGDEICFHAHQQLAKALFLQKRVLDAEGFDKVCW
jgi:hypothetical protein